MRQARRPGPDAAEASSREAGAWGRWDTCSRQCGQAEPKEDPWEGKVKGLRGCLWVTEWRLDAPPPFILAMASSRWTRGGLLKAIDSTPSIISAAEGKGVDFHWLHPSISGRHLQLQQEGVAEKRCPTDRNLFYQQRFEAEYKWINACWCSQNILVFLHLGFLLAPVYLWKNLGKERVRKLMGRIEGQERRACEPGSLNPKNPVWPLAM